MLGWHKRLKRLIYVELRPTYSNFVCVDSFEATLVLVCSECELFLSSRLQLPRLAIAFGTWPQRLALVVVPHFKRLALADIDYFNDFNWLQRMPVFRT
jgi:hypothetical protein